MASKHVTVSVEDLLKASTNYNSVANYGVDCEEATTCTSESSGLSTSWIKSNWRMIAEAVILTCVILVVWILFAIPTVFYALPPLKV